MSGEDRRDRAKVRAAGRVTVRAAVFSRYRFMLIQILRSIQRPSGPNSGPSIRIQPYGRTCQSQAIRTWPGFPAR
jgi:hypothetical protein